MEQFWHTLRNILAQPSGTHGLPGVLCEMLLETGAGGTVHALLSCTKDQMRCAATEYIPSRPFYAELGAVLIRWGLRGEFPLHLPALPLLTEVPWVTTELP
eukprot:RCo010988